MQMNPVSFTANLYVNAEGKLPLQGKRRSDWNFFTSNFSLCRSIMLLLLLSRFSRVRLCATPETAAHQAPPSLGFSRQEHWSGLPFPSPMHESERWKWSRSVVSDSLWPHGLQPTRLLHPWDFPGKSTGMGCHCLLQQKHHTNWNFHLPLYLGSYIEISF